MQQCMSAMRKTSLFHAAFSVSVLLCTSPTSAQVDVINIQSFASATGGDGSVNSSTSDSPATVEAGASGVSDPFPGNDLFGTFEGDGKAGASATGVDSDRPLSPQPIAKASASANGLTDGIYVDTGIGGEAGGTASASVTWQYTFASLGTTGLPLSHSAPYTVIYEVNATGFGGSASASGSVSFDSWDPRTGAYMPYNDSAGGTIFGGGFFDSVPDTANLTALTGRVSRMNLGANASAGVVAVNNESGSADALVNVDPFIYIDTAEAEAALRDFDPDITDEFIQSFFDDLTIEVSEGIDIDGFAPQFATGIFTPCVPALGGLGLPGCSASPPAVPVPAALPLLGSALVGLGFLVRRRIA